MRSRHWRRSERSSCLSSRCLVAGHPHDGDWPEVPILTVEMSTMLLLPFNPADLATALPDVVAAIVIASVLAFITFTPRGRSSEDDS